MKIKIKVLAPILAVLALYLSPSAAAMPEKLVPMGDVVGISVRTEGIEVTELSYIDTESGLISPAAKAGIKPGDIIISVNGKSVTRTQELSSAVKACNESIRLLYRRGGVDFETEVTPVIKDGEAILGVWVRDSINGIGTVTFYDPETQVFGALGHPVSEDDKPENWSGGTIHPASVEGIIEGKAGTPGQLGGAMDTSETIGSIFMNCDAGVFGRFSTVSELQAAIPVAMRNEIRAGRAAILSAASGEVREYEIEIVKVYKDTSDTRSMLIRVTDPELVNLTGGIVQGMSGSPIIQNGKLVGAVTHVLIADPCKGYAISIEEMLERCESTSAYKGAA